MVANLKRLAALGLEIHITELDVAVSLPVTAEKLQQQADVYRNYLEACLSVANCKAFVMWGFTDKYSWIPRFISDKGAGLPLDETFKPKPAYKAIFDELRRGIADTTAGTRFMPEHSSELIFSRTD